MAHASPWSEAAAELQREMPNDRVGSKAAWAKVLHKRVKALSDYTGRPCLIYATACTVTGKQLQIGSLQIDFSDKIGFYEITHSVGAVPIDLLIHSPGGFHRPAKLGQGDSVKLDVFPLSVRQCHFAGQCRRTLAIRTALG